LFNIQPVTATKIESAVRRWFVFAEALRDLNAHPTSTEMAGEGELPLPRRPIPKCIFRAM